mgnify:CR=1 FL=1
MGKLNTRDEIIEKARELANMIANTEEVEFFKQAELKINENVKVQQAIAKIRRLQKEAVRLKQSGKFEEAAEVEKKIDKIQDELDEIPLVQEFKRSQMEVNDLLQLVSVTISNRVTDAIIESTGGDKLRGTTVKNPMHFGCGGKKSNVN